MFLIVGPDAYSAAAGGHLHDAVGAGLGEALQSRVQGLRGADVDRRVGEVVLLRLVDHLGVDLGSCDGHGVTLSAREPNRRRLADEGQSFKPTGAPRGSATVGPLRGVVAAGGAGSVLQGGRSTPKRPPEYARAVLSRVAGKTSSWSSGTDSECPSVARHRELGSVPEPALGTASEPRSDHGTYAPAISTPGRPIRSAIPCAHRGEDLASPDARPGSEDGEGHARCRARSP